MRYYIGCSGWSYKHWKGVFYPDDLPQTKWLQHYVKHFNTVEINSTFYRFPRKEILQQWYNETPDDFTFTLKGSRYITHMKKLKNVEESVQNFYEEAQVMGDKIGCILWQLPPNLHRNDDKLEAFGKALSNDFRNVIEFRHESWFNDDVCNILQKHNIGFCIISTPDLPEIIRVTADVVYVRFHGKDEEWYTYNYGNDELQRWAEAIKKLQAPQQYIYFNNDYRAHAVQNAQQLSNYLSK
jgi:uncharacterized protein YecE (DUF72 family)